LSYNYFTGRKHAPKAAISNKKPEQESSRQSTGNIDRGIQKYRPGTRMTRIGRIHTDNRIRTIRVLSHFRSFNATALKRRPVVPDQCTSNPDPCRDRGRCDKATSGRLEPKLSCNYQAARPHVLIASLVLCPLHHDAPGIN
jgi:hypothetical protein